MVDLALSANVLMRIFGDATGVGAPYATKLDTQNIGRFQSDQPPGAYCKAGCGARLYYAELRARPVELLTRNAFRRDSGHSKHSSTRALNAQVGLKVYFKIKGGGMG